MRQMKNSEIEWIGNIPDDWSISRYKFFATSKMGETILASDTKETGIPIYSATQDGKIFGYIDKANLLLKKGDIVIPARGNSIGYATLIKDELATCTQTTICSCNVHDCLSEYLVYCCYGLKDYWFRYDGSAIPQITVKQVDNNFLPIQSIDIQQKIVGYLDNRCAQIDRLIAHEEATIEELKAYKQSVITEAVTKGLDKSAPMKDSGIEWIGEIPAKWKVVRMKNLGRCRNGLTYTPENLVSEDEGMLVLRSSNIKDGKLIFTDNVYVNTEIKDDLKVKDGDILICSRNGSRALIGKNALIPEGLNASFGAFMMIFRCSSSKYIQWVLNSDVFSYYLGTFLTATINQLTADNFNNMKIVYCDDITEQKQITDYLDKKCGNIDNLISIKQQKIEELKEYKKSLIYEYVTGKKEVA